MNGSSICSAPAVVSARLDPGGDDGDRGALQRDQRDLVDRARAARADFRENGGWPRPSSSVVHGIPQRHAAAIEGLGTAARSELPRSRADTADLRSADPCSSRQAKAAMHQYMRGAYRDSIVIPAIPRLLDAAARRRSAPSSLNRCGHVAAVTDETWVPIASLQAASRFGTAAREQDRSKSSERRRKPEAIQRT